MGPRLVPPDRTRPPTIHLTIPMRYCHSCRRLTAGQPLFCDHCGRTYDARLCPRLHVNPRAANVCGECGSRELSQPQADRPWTTRAGLSLLGRLPGALLWALTALLLVAMVVQVSRSLELQARLLGAALLLALGWWAYTQLPGPVRRAASRLASRARGRRGR